jgi:hypothetical protein
MVRHAFCGWAVTGRNEAELETTGEGKKVVRQAPNGQVSWAQSFVGNGHNSDFGHHLNSSHNGVVAAFRAH